MHSEVVFGIKFLTKTNGEYVGTFGQSEEWNLKDLDTWQHPLKPLDVILAEMEVATSDEQWHRLKEQVTLTKKHGGKRVHVEKGKIAVKEIIEENEEKLAVVLPRMNLEVAKPKTADLMKRGYRTWYADSMFAREHKYRHAYQGPTREKKRVVISRRMKDYELAVVDVARTREGYLKSAI